MKADITKAYNKVAKNNPCPCCGYCPTCGRKNQIMINPLVPMQPSYPWWQLPYTITCDGTTGQGSSTNNTIIG